MDIDEKLDVLRRMTGDGDGDDVLLAYLNLAGSAIIARRFPYGGAPAEVPEQFELRQLEIANYLLNKRGAEGQTAHSENGVSRTYESAGIPGSMLSDITPCVGVI